MHLEEKRPIHSGETIEDSSFTLNYRKHRKIKRKTHKRKVTKILHTFCLAIRKNDGQIQKVYFQKIVSTFERNPEVIEKITKDTIDRHIKKNLSKYQDNITQKQQEKNSKKEEIIPQQNLFNWEQMNLIMYPNQFNWQGYPFVFQY